jgi:hypothetical protein
MPGMEAAIDILKAEAKRFGDIPPWECRELESYLLAAALLRRKINLLKEDENVEQS